MSKKLKKGKGNKSLSSDNGAVRKQKAAQYADKSLKQHMADKSPVGTCESEDIFDETEFDNFTAKEDGSKRKNIKRNGNNVPIENFSENQDKERLKKAAAVKQAAENKIAESRKSDIIENDCDVHNPDLSETAKSETKPKANSDKESIPQTNNDKAADPQTVRRLKKAAYIKQMNAAKISAQPPPEGNDEYSENGINENAETEKNIEDNGISESENIPFEEYGFEIDKDKFKEDFVKGYAAEQFKKDRTNYGGGSSNVILETAKVTSEFVSAVQSGDAVNVVALPIKQVVEKKFGESKALRNAKVVSSSVKNADSIGGAAAGIGTAIAADKAKRYISGLLFGSHGKKDKERKSKKYRYIKRDNTPNSERTAKSQRYKVKAVEKNAAAKKNLQRKTFLKHNKDTLPYMPKADIKQSIKKKIFSKLIFFAAPAVLPVFLILIAVILISSLFSWLNPFSFILAGSDSETAAETNDEILDGYTLMIQNYMDIAQANYYLEYGDWYGGIYDYPSAEECLSFSDFFAAKCEYITASIREQFASALANAPNDQARAEIGRAMGEAISNALRQAQEGAAEEYQAFIDGLNDCMTAEENRQHYEVKNSGGANGTVDTTEFNGKPIEGTNFFDDVEIQSDLSAEELVAMAALYKSLLLIQSGGTAEDGTEYEYNITPEDIMTFFEDTEYIPITAEITHNNSCAGQNCRRRLTGDYESGYSWEYYCLSDHDNLNGSIDPCISKDELLEKIMELTEAEENGFDSDQCEEMIDEYIKTIKKELDIDENDYRQFGAEDNERAKEFYEILIDPEQGEISNNCWEIPLPVVGESEET